MNRYGARVSPCGTPARMSNSSVSPYDVITFAFSALVGIFNYMYYDVWDAISFHDLDHFASMYGVESFLEINESYHC